MADTKISALTAASDLASATVPIVQGGANKKAAISLFDDRYAGAASVRTILTADTTYHAIDYPSPMGVGGETGTGTALDPFVGPQFALDWLQKNIDTAGYNVRLEIDSDIATENAPDGFTALAVDYFPLVGGGELTIAFTGGSKSTCATSGVGINSLAPLLTVENADFDGIDDSVYFGHVVAAAGEIDLFNPKFGKAGTAQHYYAAIRLSGVGIGGSAEIYGSAANHALATNGATVADGADYTLTGTPAFDTFAVGFDSAVIEFLGTFTGSATGKLYDGQTGTSIHSTNTLPGDAPGTLDATSSYNGVFGAASTVAGNKITETGNGPFTVADDTSILVLNRGSPGASSVVLGALADRAGLDLRIFDLAGNAGDITITPDGSETIMGAATWTLGSSADGKAAFHMIPDTDNGTWLAGA